jgi:hypothetical protein
MLTTNVAANAEAEWSYATTYALNDLKIVTGTGGGAATETNKVYRSLQNTNLNHDPTTDSQLATPLWWTEVGSTLRFKMFDQIEGSQSTRTTSLTVTIVPTEIVTAIAFKNLTAYQVYVKLTSTADGIVYEQTHSLVDDGLLVDEWAWCFEPIEIRDDLAILNLPPYNDASIEITITNTTGVIAGAGVCALGHGVNLGAAQWSAEMGIIDYSQKEIDATTGFATLIEGNYSETGKFRIITDTASAGAVRRLLTSVRATPIALIYTDQLDGALMWGITREFKAVYEDAAETIFQIDFIGLR